MRSLKVHIKSMNHGPTDRPTFNYVIKNCTWTDQLKILFVVDSVSRQLSHFTSFFILFTRVFFNKNPKQDKDGSDKGSPRFRKSLERVNISNKGRIRYDFKFSHASVRLTIMQP